MRFNSKGDYKAEFEREVNELIDQNIEDRQERIKAIAALVDDYSLYIGEAPDPVQLERLADYILREELTDKNPYKVSHNEYPIFSESQIKRRKGTEARPEAACYVANDGRDYRTPRRRNRTINESIWIDRKAKSRNKERRAKYREYTKPGPVKIYFLDGANKT